MTRMLNNPPPPSLPWLWGETSRLDGRTTALHFHVTDKDGAAPVDRDAAREGGDNGRKERGAALPLTAHRCGLRLCREQLVEQRRKRRRGGVSVWRRFGGGGVSMMKEESQMGQTARDRLNSVKELYVSSLCCLKDKDRCKCASRWFSAPARHSSLNLTCYPCTQHRYDYPTWCNIWS